ncbi:MAG: glycosyltransferase family 4 protein [Planctomycetales bacterium]|nr:glycosyltransferase family 4 protein [Planctomycetales bacterium]
MAERIVYVVATPSPNRNTEMDRVATVLGPDRVHLIFIASEWQSASWRPSFPDVCPFHCLDAPADLNGIAADEIVGLLGSLDPSVVVVGGYAQKAARDVMAWSRQRRVPYCLRSDSSIWTDRHKGWAKYTVRRIRLPRHVKAAHRCLISGRFNREFWQRYGMRPAQEGWWPQWIDYDRFAAARTIGVDERHSLLAAHGIETTLNFLYVGRLIGLKHLDRLCEGLADCPPHAGLIVVGSGPEEANLRQRYGDSLAGRLHLVGSVEPGDLPQWYAAADALVLASGARENWGLVINEAATAGLPVLCHRHVGAAGDLVVDGRSGMALASNDTQAWREAMYAAAAQPERLAAMGHESAQLADAWRERSEPVRCIEQLFASLE